MRKNIFRSILCSLLFLVLSGCNDPVFYEVSTQVKSPKPIVKGSPTNFASINVKEEIEVVYVASGNSVHYYFEKTETDPETNEESKAWTWSRTDPSLGRITYLAATDSELFILTPNGVHKTTPSGEPDTTNHLVFSQTPISVSGYRFITMYSAGNQIFVGAKNDAGTSYSIFKITSSTAEEMAETNNGLLNGAAFNGTNYFFSVKDQVTRSAGGIYSDKTSPVSLVGDNYSIPFMGIISIGNTVIAISRNGVLYNAETVETLKNNDGGDISTGKTSNGVLSVVNAYNYDSEKWDGAPLLLAGRQDALTYDVYSGYTYGYLEIELDGDSVKPDGAFREPGVNTSSAASLPSTLERVRGSNDTFRTTIGTYVIKFIFQSKDSYNTIFSSTHQNGVWSLRDQNDKSKNYPYWNSEN